MITFINSYSVALATKVQNVFTAAKLLAVVIIVIGGITKLAQGEWDSFLVVLKFIIYW